MQNLLWKSWKSDRKNCKVIKREESGCRQFSCEFREKVSVYTNYLTDNTRLGIKESFCVIIIDNRCEQDRLIGELRISSFWRHLKVKICCASML